MNISASSNSFRSEIDWSSWNPEIPCNKELLNEYMLIEKKSKEDGTWMKSLRDDKIFSRVDEINLEGLKDKIQNDRIREYDLPAARRAIEGLEAARDNSVIYQGTCEQFVQEHSTNFKNAFSRPSITYRGGLANRTYKGPLTGQISDLGSVFTADKRSAIHYGKDNIIKGPLDDNIGFLELWFNESDNSFGFSANGAGWKDIARSSIPGPHSADIMILSGNGNFTTTEHLARYIESKGIDYVRIRNVFDGIEIKEEIIFNHRKGNYLKSRWFNNGMFDMTNPGIYN